MEIQTRTEPIEGRPSLRPLGLLLTLLAAAWLAALVLIVVELI
jgi:hypothetical protein